MISFPNAKINIGLHITEKRDDGFHNIESIFYPIDWQDALEATPAPSIKLDSSGLAIPGAEENNLIIKAFHILKPLIKTGAEVHFHLHKVIPMGAGLGGGSADGAFALKLLNNIFELGLSVEELEHKASLLGSDCPFFIKNKPVYCYDRGIKFKDIDLKLSDYHIYVINPNIHISTAEAYSCITPSKPKHHLMDTINLPVLEWKHIIQNDFEIPLAKKYPKIKDIKKELYEMGAAYAAMTGSGSTVYGIFKNEIIANSSFKNFNTWQGKML